MQSSPPLSLTQSNPTPPGAAELPAPETAGGLMDPVVEWVAAHPTAEWIIGQMGEFDLAQAGKNILGAVATFVIGRWVAKIVTNAIVRGAKKARIDATLIGFLDNLIYMLLLTVVCVSALGQLGVQTTSLTAVLAAAGFAVGMALQGSLGNLAAGVMLVFFKPFRVGDLVEVSGQQGTVVEIQIFNTILVTLDNVRIIVPNSKITDGTIQNYSAERERRIDLVIGCGYNDDLKAVKSELQKLVGSDPRILAIPEPTVAVAELGDSSVNFVVRPWVQSQDYWDVRFDLTEKIKLSFDEHGFTIPFPSQDLFLHKPDTETAATPIKLSRAA